MSINDPEIDYGQHIHSCVICEKEYPCRMSQSYAVECTGRHKNLCDQCFEVVGQGYIPLRDKNGQFKKWGRGYCETGKIRVYNDSERN